MSRMPKRKPRPGVDEYGRTPLWYCACHGDLDGIQREVAGGADLNQGDDAGDTPLHVAAQQRKVDAITLLLKLGADPNKQDTRGKVPLWRVLMQANAAGARDIIQLLLDAGADPHLPNERGNSPYSFANKVGHGLEQLFNSRKQDRK